MIRLENISKAYPDGELFSHVNIVLKKGMRVGLVGPNGSGKTTLLRLMLGDESPDSGYIQKDKLISIGYLAQDIIVGSKLSIIEEVLSAYPEVRKIEGEILKLSNAIANEPENMKLVNKLGEKQNRFEALGGWTLEEKAKKILSGLGFPEEKMVQPMEVFSGGWRMRVALASILLQQPDILFLDEPTNHLDLEATIWLESFLADWKGSIVMISHDRAFLDRSVNHILEIDLKKITLYHGNYSKYEDDKELRKDLHRNAYRNQQKQIKDTERFIERFRYKNTKATQVQSRVKMLEKMEKIEEPIEDNSSVKIVLPQSSRPPLKLVSCQNVTKHYENVEVFNEMNLIVERGQKIGLVGHNGAGKSTLLKMLAGVESVTSGAVRISSGIDSVYYAQHQLEILDPDNTVYDSIQHVNPGLSETEIRTYLGSFMFNGDEIEKYIKVLSGGEKARVAMARILIQPVHLLLLDEPTNHLDMVTRNVVEMALAKFKGSIICISHDRHFLNTVTNLTCEVGNGSIRIFEGNYDYYDWKKSEENSISQIKLTKKVESKGKIDYKKKKKIRNRLTWIKKRFKRIEIELENQRSITKDPANGDNFELLNQAMETMNTLEIEYLDLIDEQDKLLQ